MAGRLTMIGKLIGFTRQLDIFLSSDRHVERYVSRFFEGKFHPSEGSSG